MDKRKKLVLSGISQTAPAFLIYFVAKRQNGVSRLLNILRSFLGRSKGPYSLGVGLPLLLDGLL